MFDVHVFITWINLYTTSNMVVVVVVAAPSPPVVAIHTKLVQSNTGWVGVGHVAGQKRAGVAWYNRHTIVGG